MLVQNRYHILSELGSGGFGNTFLAEDTHLPSNRRCAIKQLKPIAHTERYQERQRRFQREAVILEKLGEESQGQIPKLYAYFVEGEYFYLVQEWIDGETLREKVEREGSLNESEVREIVIGLLRVLDYTHSQNIIHRDIKPENVMLRKQGGKPVLIDFGLVKEVVNVDAQGNPTSSMFVGTRVYMALEQAAGKPTYSSDIYSLGLTAIYLLTGIDPKHDSFTGNLIWRGNAANVSPGFAEILEKAAESYVRDRYKTAQEMLDALQANGDSLKWMVYSFNTVKVDSVGQVIEQYSKQARCFVEDLGNGVSLDMVEIPGGEFLMGSSEADAEEYRRDMEQYNVSTSDARERSLSETPRHRVTVSGFFIGKYQVTQAQWQAVMGNNPSHFKGENLPVENVSWDDAVEFCQRLSKQTGRQYRLPSEAEWEYACRAGSVTAFAFGETITPLLVNYDGSYPYGSAPKGEYRGKTIEVGNLGIANRFGLYDMHGNVWERCLDVWHDNYEGAPVDGSAWESGGDATLHVVRGGSWYSNGSLCRSAIRNRVRMDTRLSTFGFRVVVATARTQS
ncbi:MAG: bifunctional serine/threonine-protein kinase/formylglycine-generating enzyme family protein [Acidobacteriota bacterium]